MVLGDNMYTMKDNVSETIEIKNSKFISLLIKIQKEEDVKPILEKAKMDYKEATHYCYAYITSSSQKASDDGEPGGTAGMPILNVLQKKQLKNVLCIVVRYFGGIKLGAGGLVRAYSKSVTEALKKTQLIPLVPGYQIELHVSYDQQKTVELLLKNATILARSFQEEVILLANVTKEEIEKLNQHAYSFQIREEMDIEKEF